MNCLQMSLLILNVFYLTSSGQQNPPNPFNFNGNPAELEEIKKELLERMFYAQDTYRNDNGRKSLRKFNEDWETCNERYRFPKCCEWKKKKHYERDTWDCKYIKGDVILDNDHDAHVFQSFLDIIEIQGNLILRNTSILVFGMPHIQKIGFSGSNPNKFPAALIVENNKFLTQFRLRRLEVIARHKTQKFGIFRNNPHLKIDVKQFHRLNDSCDGCSDFDEFIPHKVRYYRYIMSELYPYFLFGAMIVVIFTHHFIMLEVNQARVARKEAEVIECLEKMRDSTLAAELLLQTPCDVQLAFDQDVLHLCNDQVELIRQIQKLLDDDVAAFNDPSMEEVTPKGENDFESTKEAENPKK